MTGDDHALPWTGVFHFTFSDSLQVSGRSRESDRPSPFGPRNCGQSSLAHAEIVSRAAFMRKSIRVIVVRVLAKQAAD